jgi:cyclopropane fatty-acyl-phospholipid synthase-like methyltransferase
MNIFSNISLMMEDIIMPRRLRKEIAETFANMKDKRVLEFGSGVGTLTVHIAERVGRGGKVYAVSLSEADVGLLRKRLTKLGHTHVQVIHDPHLISRVHPDVKGVDFIISIGHLSYIQNVGNVLKEMNSLLPRRGRIMFVEYVDFFYFLPDPKWLSKEETIREEFTKAGFSVNIRIKQGFLWKYLYIEGVKEEGNAPFI